jgi:hypothetical protein
MRKQANLTYAFIQLQKNYTAIGKVEAVGAKVVRDIPLRRFTDGDQDELTNLTRKASLLSNFVFDLSPSKSQLCSET